MKTLVDYINEGLFGGSKHKAPNVYPELEICEQEDIANMRWGDLVYEKIDQQTGKRNIYIIQVTGRHIGMYGHVVVHFKYKTAIKEEVNAYKMPIDKDDTYETAWSYKDWKIMGDKDEHGVWHDYYGVHSCSKKVKTGSVTLIAKGWEALEAAEKAALKDFTGWKVSSLS